MTTDPATGRARLVEIRAGFLTWATTYDHSDLLRMAEDGIAAREALSRVTAELDRDADDAHGQDCARWRKYLAPRGPRPCDCGHSRLRRAITGGES